MSALRVALLKGGPSLERQVSLRSAARVQDALERLGMEVVPIDVDSGLIGRLRESGADVAFVALHGRGGEDGTVQELLEIVGMPYTGSGVLACMRSMDKVLTKHLLMQEGLPTPDFFAFSEIAFRELGAADALPIVEARTKQEYFFDFEARYEIGKTDYFCPADVEPEVTARAQDLAVETYRLLGCYGFARVDMILAEDGALQVLEAQAIPGLTETSLLPQAAEAGGISFDRLVERLVELALRRAGAQAVTS